MVVSYLKVLKFCKKGEDFEEKSYWLNPYLSEISSIRPLGEDEGDTIQHERKNDRKQDAKVISFVKAAELFKNGIHVNWVGCY